MVCSQVLLAAYHGGLATMRYDGSSCYHRRLNQLHRLTMATPIRSPTGFFVGDVYVSVSDTDQGCIIGLPAPHFCLENHTLKSSSASLLPHASS